VNQRGRGILVLSLVILALASIYIFITFNESAKQSSTRVEADPYPEPLASVNPLEVHRITVSGTDGFSVERNGETFSLVSPALAYPLLDQDAVGNLFRALARPAPDMLVYDSTATTPQDGNDALPALSDFGLDSPTVVTVDYHEKPSLTLEFGGPSPGGKIYGSLGGDPRVWTFPKADTDLFLGGLRVIRNRDLPFVDLQDLQSLAMKTRGQTLDLLRDDTAETGFYLSPFRLLAPYPVTLPVDGDALSRLLARIKPFSISTFIDDPVPPSHYGLDPPHGVLSLKDSTRELVIVVGNDVPGVEGEVYARLGTMPFVFTLAATSLEFMGTTNAFDLVAKLPMLVPVDSVGSIDIDQNGIRRTLSIKRASSPAGGTVKGEELFYASGNAVEESAFLEAYKALIGIALEGDLPAELIPKLPEKPSLAVTMHRTDGKSGLAFQFFDASKDFMAYRWAPGLWFAVSKSQIAAALRTMDSLLQP
jgi:hypothetical protein